MIHIVFEPSGAEVLQKSFELDETLQGDVFIIRDDFAVGPIENIETEEGWNNRLSWWKSLLEGTPYTDVFGSFDDRQTVAEIIARLEADEQENVWIWAGQNQHDVCGYYWLLSYLKTWQGRIMMLYLNNLPFINEKGNIFYPTHLMEIQPKEFLKAKKLCRAITPSEFEVDPDEWTKLCADNAMVRILEGGKKIGSVGADFYDKEILSNITPDWQKFSRVMSNTLHRMKIKTGDVFLAWRIGNMVAAHQIDRQGDPAKGWKDIELKLPAKEA
jgi:Domain of unknown function (DUF1835)/Protein of unknown function